MKISICVINKNTEKTIEKSMRSVLNQLDETYEVVIIDESTDNSPKIIEKLRKEFPTILRPYYFSDKPLGSIGAARNKSISLATGQYCIMHIDCDDIWQPYIKYFVEVFFEIEKNYRKKFLLAGHQINMARRDFLLSIGPYQDIKHGEDRDLWMRLAKLGQYMPIDHIAFFERIPLGRKTNKIKTIKRVYWSIEDEAGGGKTFCDFFDEFFEKQAHLTLSIKIARLIFYPYVLFKNYAFINERRRSKANDNLYFDDYNEWNEYKTKHTGTYSQISAIWGFPSSLDFITNPAARKIFQSKRSDQTIDSVNNSSNTDE